MALFFQKHLMAGVAGAVLSLAATQPGFAQSTNPATAALPPAGAFVVPADILNNAMTGTGGNQAIRDYLGTADQSSGEVTRRASALIAALGGEKGDAAGDSPRAQQIKSRRYGFSNTFSSRGLIGILV